VTDADKLVRELSEKIGLEAVDAHRSAFTALACSSGWTKARVGRWLGISRARVGQKVDKLLYYATTRKDVPTLTRVMTTAANIRASRSDYDDLVAYEPEEWDDLDLARRLIDSVVDGSRRAA
jgi:hypothetical protein